MFSRVRRRIMMMDWKMNDEPPRVGIKLFVAAESSTEAVLEVTASSTSGVSAELSPATDGLPCGLPEADWTLGVSIDCNLFIFVASSLKPESEWMNFHVKICRWELEERAQNNSVKSQLTVGFEELGPLTTTVSLIYEMLVTNYKRVR